MSYETDMYIRTALWCGVVQSEDGLLYDADASQLADETRERMEADCERFLEQAAPLIEAARDRVQFGPDCDFAEERAAHDFWLTRNRHGAGFWDGDWPEPQATELTKLAHSFSEVDLYVGDDGMIYAG